MMPDRTELIEQVAWLVEKTVPELVADRRVPAHLLKHVLEEVLCEALRPWIEEHASGEKYFRIFMRRVVDEAVDAVLAAQGRAC
jgi:hypothetical protein